MTLVRKIFLKMGLLLAGFALLGAASIWSLLQLRDDNHVAIREFNELRDMESDNVRVATARAQLVEGADPSQARRLIQSSIDNLQKFVSTQAEEVDEDDADAEHDRREKSFATEAVVSLKATLAAVSANEQGSDRHDALVSPTINVSKATVQLDHAIWAINQVCQESAAFVKGAQASGRTRLRLSILTLSVLSLTTFSGALAIAWSLARSVMHPLWRLRDGVRKMAAGQFSERVEPAGDLEFREVAGEFNRMARELEEFYQRLEQRVADTSKVLVRSERLASVGYLAAGIAHEIRNPLGVIAGYAELSLKRLQGSAELRSATRDGQLLGVIRDEAFRCKAITDRLLGLVQGGDDQREPVQLLGVVKDVVFLIHGLATHQQSAGALRIDVPESFRVLANLTEMKQVVLNLVLNAIDATQADQADVAIEATAEGEWIELSVRDNGCGLTPPELDRVFEPFYTTKRGAAAPGTGLGLSIVHAIVENFGGTIRVDSEGPGLGTRFVIRLRNADNPTALNRRMERIGFSDSSANGKTHVR